jgi:transitional endoplasmic reticulum ATPase
MTRTRIRDFHDDDLDGIIHLVEAAEQESSADSSDFTHSASAAEPTAAQSVPAPPLYPLSEILAACQRNQAVVADPR